METHLNNLCREIATARKAYFQGESTDQARSHLEALENEAEKLSNEHALLVAKAQQIVGLTDEMLEALEEERFEDGDNEVRLERQTLAGEKFSTTELIEDALPQALEYIYDFVDKDWLKEQRELFRKNRKSYFESPLSLVKGVRIESEFPSFHRLAQTIFVCEDHLNSERNIDIFASALLVPQTACLGSHFSLLKEVGGETEERIRSLWRGVTEEVDSTVFELLVASSCAALGRKIEFLKPDHKKSPDLRVHDYPFPLVVECKRKRSVSTYEIHEESKMRVLFDLLNKAASAKGMWGIFDLELDVEAHNAPLNEIVDCSIRQRLAASSSKPTSYDWGSIAFKELPKQLSGPKTRVYSPLFLRDIFSWNSDLPSHDGIICKIASPEEILIDFAEEPIALLWRSNAPEAIRKKSWSPVDLFGDATNQISAGEVGLIYVCYQEGAREWIADHRTQSYITRMSKWHHSGGIRLPVNFLIRIYPRILGHGAPDLIENGVRFMSELYGDRVYFADFPTTVFTLLGE